MAEIWVRANHSNKKPLRNVVFYSIFNSVHIKWLCNFILSHLIFIFPLVLFIMLCPKFLSCVYPNPRLAWWTCYQFFISNSFSGFAVVLLVIHYLQAGCTPPVVPALQQIFPDVFQTSNNVLIDKLIADVPLKIRSFKSENKQSLGELLIGFFQYYSTFNWDKTMSIRTGGTRPTPMYDKIWRGPYIRLEDPSDGGNVTRSVFDVDEFSRIKRAFDSAASQLRRNASLEGIF